MIEKAVKDPNNRLARKFPDIYRKYLIFMRVLDYSPNTEKSYLAWIKRFLLFHSEKHPCDCGEIELASFLEHSGVNRKIFRALDSPNTYNRELGNGMRRAYGYCP
ncbi:MAG: hypothetical protein B6D77_05835 [gamma proteobacterium symbiont of Ctena orbiculata]|nr:MAG: hypothetical protein B6D77_05835 [gamma proteobacterium symbiont of Ctena orbiculata]